MRPLSLLFQRFLSLSLVLFFFCFFVPQSLVFAAQEKTEGEILTRLSNGLTVYLVPDKRFPLVCTRLYVFTGSANERAEEAGISHVLEHMVFKGTEHRPKGVVAKEVESLGGYLNAATSFDRTWYITDMPSQHWKVGLDVVKDMAFSATLDPAELEPEKDVIVSELKGGDDSPEHKLFEALQTAALKHSPYGRPIIGFEPTIRKVSSESLRQYRDTWYQPQNMALLVAGDIDSSAVLSYVQELFGSLNNTHELSALPDVPLATAPDEEVVHVERGPWKKVYLGLSFPAPSLRDLRSVDLDVLCYLLAGDPTSFFLRKYKYERELVENLSVDNMSLGRAGMLSLTAELESHKVPAFFEALCKDFAELDPSRFTRSEIDRAVLNLEESMDRAGETLSGLAGWKSTVMFLMGGSVGEQNLRTRLANISVDELEAARKAWFDPAKLRIRVLAPQDAKLPDFAAMRASLWPESKAREKGETAYLGGERQEIALENGCSLILLPDRHAPYLSLNMTRFGGNALLSNDEQGLSHLTASLLTDGAGDLDTQALEAFLAARALSLSVSSGRQSFNLRLEGPSRFARDMYGVLTKVLTAPRFDEKELEREKRLQLSAFKQREDQPLRYLFAKIRPLLFPGHVYGYDDLGTPALLKGFDTAKVRAFWQKQSCQPWILTVAGSFAKDEILAVAKALSQRAVDKKNRVAAPAFGQNRKLDLSLAGKSQAHLLTIFPTVPLDHPDAPGLLLLAKVLSGQSGLLFSSMRDEEGLGYTVTAFERSLPTSGVFILYIGTVAEKIAQAREGFKKVIDRLQREALPARELEAGVNQLLGEYVRSSQSLAARANEASSDAFLGHPAHFTRILIDKAARLSPDDLMALARKYLRLDAAYTVTLKP